MGTALRTGALLFASLGEVAVPASLSNTMIPVPSDPDSRYELIRREETGLKAWMQVERTHGSEISYLEVRADCSFSPVITLAAAATIAELRKAQRVGAGYDMTGIAEEFWQFACITGASPAFRDQTLRELDERRRAKVQVRIQNSRPVRRDTPTRKANISDEEIEQVTATARRLLPGAIVNIGTVVTGCPCEDGPACTDQVWIVAYRPEQSIGRLLSKIGGHWEVGPLQQWWLDYEDLLSGKRFLTDEEQERLIETFPKCEAADAGQLPN